MLNLAGPFAKTAEWLGGYFMMECRDLDEALELAARHPTAKAGLGRGPPGLGGLEPRGPVELTEAVTAELPGGPGPRRGVTREDAAETHERVFGAHRGRMLPALVRRLRGMVKALNKAGLRVVMDVVKESSYDRTTGTFTVPRRAVAMSTAG